MARIKCPKCDHTFNVAPAKKIKTEKVTDDNSPPAKAKKPWYEKTVGEFFGE